MHIIEIKWRNKTVDYEDVQNFLNKVSRSGFKNAKLYFVSKTGYTKEAEALMKKE
ncbi:MAG: ATPase, partial [Candidatus Altiarchaeales archaeon HGW-Altiarchaeales-2]